MKERLSDIFWKTLGIIVTILVLNYFSVKMQYDFKSDKKAEEWVNCTWYQDTIDGLEKQRKEQYNENKIEAAELESEIKVYRMRYPNRIPNEEYDYFTSLVDSFEEVSNEINDYKNLTDGLQDSINTNRELIINCQNEVDNKDIVTYSLLPPFKIYKK